MKAAIFVGLLFVAMLLLALAGCVHPESDQVKAAQLCTAAGLIPSVTSDPMVCVIPAEKLK